MLRVGIFVDVSNLYYCTQKKFNRKIDYQKLLNKIIDFDDSYRIIYRAVAYGFQLEDEANSFINHLKRFGYEVKYKKPKVYKERRKGDSDVSICMDIVRMIDNLDIVTICTADGDLVECAKWIKERGRRVEVVGCGISRELKDTVHGYKEITEEYLE